MNVSKLTQSRVTHNTTQLQILGDAINNQNDIHDEIKSRFNSGTAYYYSVQNLLSSRLISKNLNTKL